MKSLFLGLGALALLPTAHAQTARPAVQPAVPEVIHLWANGAPGFENRKNLPEVAKDWWVRNINNPSIIVYLPPKDKATGTAVIVAPGGGFTYLVMAGQSDAAAKFLNSIGVAAFVLKYRLPQEDRSPYTLDDVRQDAYRAMRLVRSRAKEWNIDPHRVGMLGFSAGGAVVSMVAYAPGAGDPKAPDPIDRLNGRPDFQIHVSGCSDNLPDKLPPDSPPAFLIAANDDEFGCDLSTLNQLVKLRAARVRVEAIFLAQGKHTFNMGDRSNLVTVKAWPQRLADWMKDSGYLTPQPLSAAERP